MTSVPITIVAGMLFGIALAAPPGPMNAIIASESVLRGWSSGFLAGLGAMTADVIFFLLALIGVVTVIADRPQLRGVMLMIGGLLMLWFAVSAVRGVRETARQGGQMRGDVRSMGFQKAFILALTNPYQIIFWLTLGVGLLRPGQIDVLAELPIIGTEVAGWVVIQTGSPALIVGFFGGIVVWITGFPAIMVAAAERDATISTIVGVGSAVVLLGFGVLFLRSGVGLLT
jgi:threonine/homoserine/homoserine lactone efflux protein